MLHVATGYFGQGLCQALGAGHQSGLSTKCTGPLGRALISLLNTHHRLEHGDQRGQQCPTSSQMHRLKPEAHVQPCRTLGCNNLGPHSEEVLYPTHAEANREWDSARLLGQDALLEGGADDIARGVEDGPKHPCSETPSQVLELVVLLWNHHLRLLREKPQTGEIRSCPTSLTILHTKISHIQPGPATCVHDVLHHSRTIVVELLFLVQLQRNLGHLHGLDGEPFGQGADTGGDGFRQTISLTFGLSIHGLVRNREQEEFQHTHVSGTQHLRENPL
mmetsp:Transcript_108273/g.187023  ORF Transcript_108273/g.187023 Transcript_108273/m.187023 type:complete len:276 (+) Transcript_108273:660-1487(+)